MISATEKTQPRLLTQEELGLAVKIQRELRQWSQEQLGEFSGLSTRTIQRVEGGKPSDLDTRRALARAFDLEEIDAFNKPYVDIQLRRLIAEIDCSHFTVIEHFLTTLISNNDLSAFSSTLFGYCQSCAALKKYATQRYS